MTVSVGNLQGLAALIVGIFVFINPKLAVRLIGAYLVLSGLIDLGIIRL